MVRNCLAKRLGFFGLVLASGCEVSTPGADAGPTGTDAPVVEPDALVVDAPVAADSPAAPSCVAHDVACVDTQIGELSLFDNLAGTGLVVEEGEAADEFTTYVDARGMPASGTTPTVSFTYARFTEDGLEQVMISDEDAFTSTEWDIAFRRFVIRINSGTSGPGCVRAARAPVSGGADPTFEDVTEVPDGITYFEEEYYTERGSSCTLIGDGSGLPGAPDTVLAGYWSYTTAMCLGMTDYVYLLELGDGRHVRLTVVSYYIPENQTICDDGGALTPPTGAANFRVRWSYLD